MTHPSQVSISPCGSLPKKHPCLCIGTFLEQGLQRYFSAYPNLMMSRDLTHRVWHCHGPNQTATSNIVFFSSSVVFYTVSRPIFALRWISWRLWNPKKSIRARRKFSFLSSQRVHLATLRQNVCVAQNSRIILRLAVSTHSPPPLPKEKPTIYYWYTSARDQPKSKH